jgi:hypothetical protein
MIFSQRVAFRIPGLQGAVLAAASLLVLQTLACFGGGGGGGGSAPQAATLIVSPANAEIGVAGTIQFTAQGVPGGDSVAWTVAPSSAGTISSDGLFTAGTAAGSCTVTVATSATPGGSALKVAWATVTVVPGPGPVQVNPYLLQGDGIEQTGANGLVNHPVLCQGAVAGARQTVANSQSSESNWVGLYPTTTP